MKTSFDLTSLILQCDSGPGGLSPPDFESLGGTTCTLSRNSRTMIGK